MLIRTANAQATDGRAARLSNITTAQRKKTRRKHERVPASQEDRAGAPGKRKRPMFSDARRASAGWVPPGRLRPTVGLASLNGRTLLPCHSFTKAVRPDRSGKPNLASDGRFRNSNQGTPFLHPRRHWSLPRRIAGRQEPGGRREDRAKRRARDARPGSASPPALRSRSGLLRSTKSLETCEFR